MHGQTPPVLVAACGNSMAGDDAFGSLVAEKLRTMALSCVEVVDLGMKPAGVLNHLAGRVALIIVDAALPDRRFPAGSLIDIDFFAPESPQLLHDAALSSHGLSIAHELELARRIDMLPPMVYLVAASASASGVGQPPSERTRGLIGPAAQRVAALARRCLVDLPEQTHA